MKEIYLAGGCFWGVEEYFSRIEGVIETQVGYANGHLENPSYEEVCTGRSGHTESCHIIYNENKIGLEKLLEKFWAIIDPTLLNRQGPDIGSQYRTGIYYSDKEDLEIIKSSLEEEKKKYDQAIVTEIMEIQSYFKAEEYHQKYLKKNSDGYCHIDLSK